MIRIVVDESVKNEILLTGETCEVFDAAGNRLGSFVPEFKHGECPYSDEELERAASEGGGRPLKDILADLEKRK
jgi:hypothetical protein